MGPMNRDTAETIGLKALGFLAETPDGLSRLLDISGIDVATLRSRAAEPEVLGAVLDFLLTDDALVQDFCKGESLDVRDVHRARHALPGG